MKNRILLDNYYLPGDLERQIDAFVEHYNHARYHEHRQPPSGELRQSSPNGVFMFVRLPVMAAGLVYLYPEIASGAGLACGAALVYVIAEDLFRGRSKFAMTALGRSASIALIALLLIGGYWKGTLGFFLSQLRSATSMSVEWHRFFQAYLFGRY